MKLNARAMHGVSRLCIGTMSAIPVVEKFCSTIKQEVTIGTYTYNYIYIAAHGRR